MPPSVGTRAPSSPTISHRGNAQTKGKISSMISVRPGPLAEIASSMPNAPAATKEKINATTPTVDIFVFLSAPELFSFISYLLILSITQTRSISKVRDQTGAYYGGYTGKIREKWPKICKKRQGKTTCVISSVFLPVGYSLIGATVVVFPKFPPTTFFFTCQFL